MYEFIAAGGRDGATRDEIETALGMLHQTLNPRLRELEQANCIEDSGAVRKTKSGMDAVVWVVVGPYVETSSTPGLKPKTEVIKTAFAEIAKAFEGRPIPPEVNALCTWVHFRFVVPKR